MSRAPKSNYLTVEEMRSRVEFLKKHPDVWSTKLYHGGSRFDGSTHPETVFKYLSENKNAKILECGAGPGAFTKILQENGFSEIHVLDFSPGLYFPDKGKLTFHQMDLNREQMPYQDNFFDFVVAWGVVEHMENPFYFMREAHRVLKPNGVFIFSIPNVGHIMSRLIFLKRGFFPRWHAEDAHIFLLPRGVFEKTFLRYFNLVETKYTKPSIDYGIFKKLSKFLPENEYFGNWVIRVLKKKEFKSSVE